MSPAWQNPGSNYQPFIPSPPPWTPPFYTKPIQGIYQNCAFIAALMSTAWVNFEFIRELKDLPSYHIWTNPYMITFWYSPNQNTPFNYSKNVYINAQLEFDSGYPCGAKSLTPYETWPALYEKAYAKFRQWFIHKGFEPAISRDKYTMSDADLGNPDVNPGLPTKPEYIDHPPTGTLYDMSMQDWGGNGWKALAHITGGVYLGIPPAPDNYRYVVIGTQADRKCGNIYYKKIYDIIKNCLCSSFAGYNGQKTTVPVVAWTYDDPKLLSGTGLTANHNYAVLGIWKSGVSQYIVMRDPYAVDPSGSAAFAPGNTSWSWKDREYNLSYFNATIIGVMGLMPTPTTLAFSVNDGIFGLLDTDFEKYFEVVGWVTQS